MLSHASQVVREIAFMHLMKKIEMLTHCTSRSVTCVTVIELTAPFPTTCSLYASLLRPQAIIFLKVESHDSPILRPGLGLLAPGINCDYLSRPELCSVPAVLLLSDQTTFVKQSITLLRTEAIQSKQILKQ